MARKKVNLAWIANDATRRATFKKRRKGLLKKVSELATLCDVKACAVVYGPHEAQPEVWPSESEARRILTRFKAMPEMEQCKKMMNQEGFLRQRVSKLLEQLRRHERENRDLEMSVLMFEGLAGRSLHDISIEDATSLACLIDTRAKAVHERIEVVKAQMAVEAAEGSKEKTPMKTVMEALQQQNWFMEMTTPNEQLIFGNNGGVGSGGLDDLMQPYMDTGSPWMDPAFFPF